MTLRASRLIPALFSVIFSSALVLGAAFATIQAQAQQTVLPLWPHATPEPPQTTEPESNSAKPVPGVAKLALRITNVTRPTLSVFPPKGKNSGAAALVFPGGGYSRLAMDIEGADTCDWLNSVGMTCMLVKYRVPQPPGEEGHYPADFADLEDAQQAMRLARAHASEWHIDANHIGVIGFSAGGNLAVLLSSHPDDHHVESTPAAPDVNSSINARANFAIVVYPAYLAMPPDETTLFPAYAPGTFTPDTFLIQAENDRTYGHNALVYYRALMDAHVPAQLHYYATGGHGFGTYPTGKPEDHWTDLATTWLRNIGMLPTLSSKDTGPASPQDTPNPCTRRTSPPSHPSPVAPHPSPAPPTPTAPPRNRSAALYPAAHDPSSVIPALSVIKALSVIPALSVIKALLIIKARSSCPLFVMPPCLSCRRCLSCPPCLSSPQGSAFALAFAVAVACFGRCLLLFRSH